MYMYMVILLVVECNLSIVCNFMIKFSARPLYRGACFLKVLAKQGDFSRLYTVPPSISLYTLLYGWTFGLTTYQSTN